MLHWNGCASCKYQKGPVQALAPPGRSTTAQALTNQTPTGWQRCSQRRYPAPECVHHTRASCTGNQPCAADQLHVFTCRGIAPRTQKSRIASQCEQPEHQPAGPNKEQLKPLQAQQKAGHTAQQVQHNVHTSRPKAVQSGGARSQADAPTGHPVCLHACALPAASGCLRSGLCVAAIASRASAMSPRRRSPMQAALWRVMSAGPYCGQSPPLAHS